MANKNDKVSSNVAGKFYVDSTCIDCDVCRATAPANFARDHDGGHSFVKAQPANEAEAALCQDALESCPVDAIGSDGD